MLYVNHWCLLKSLRPDSPVFAGDYLDDDLTALLVNLIRIATRVMMQGM